ncbi:hypothetical protein ACFVMC_29015 [Nocardia sp. NPDC127579]|uniref:hypothetical protein n=1 Tax=Nocardia sp. NPDC127579 TaxID=3345402 RepID=UPI0036332B36
MVWHGPPGVTPWEIATSEPCRGWPVVRRRRTVLSAHPQEVTEHSVDIGPVIALHGFGDVRIIEPLVLEGPRARMTYGFAARLPGIGTVDARIHIAVDGLGFSMVETAAAGWRMRQLVVGTPIGVGETIVHSWTSLPSRGRSRIGRAAWHPVGAIVDRALAHTTIAQLARGELMWSRRKYPNRPVIGASDGLVGRYRAWAQQFYPDGAATR